MVKTTFSATRVATRTLAPSRVSIVLDLDRWLERSSVCGECVAQILEHLQRAALVQHVVELEAFGGLNASRTPVAARALARNRPRLVDNLLLPMTTVL